MSFFLLLVFVMNQFPPSPWVYIPLGPFQIFFFIRRDIHSSQWHCWQICHRYQRHRRQTLPPVSLVLLISVQICHWCQRHRWQTMGLISGCRYLKVNLKAKMYMYVNSTIQRCPNKIIKIFLAALYLPKDGSGKLFCNDGEGDPHQALLEDALGQQAACQLWFHFQEEIKGRWCEIWQIMELGEHIDAFSTASYWK